ncbi:MAG: PEP-CTERM sorting domain-containing protein [Phycisphaeraceae bacterium]
MFTSTAVTAQAEVILLNFGATISDDTNSAMHEHGGAVGTNWNLITTSDVGSGIVTDTGNATSATVNLGRGASGTVNWASQPSSAAPLGNLYNTGIYAGNGRSATYTGSGDMGVRIGGLAAGAYEIYFSGRNTNAPNAELHRYYYETVDATSGNTSYSAGNSFVITYEGATDFSANTPNTWDENIDYGVLQYTIADGEDIVLIGSPRGFIGTMGIVIPEPASMAVLGVGGLAIMFRRRQR